MSEIDRLIAKTPRRVRFVLISLGLEAGVAGTLIVLFLLGWLS